MPETICSWGERIYGSIKRKADSRLHYTLLPDNLKAPYLRIVDACYNSRNKVIFFDHFREEELRTLVSAIHYDNPSLVREPTYTSVSSLFETKIRIH